MTFWQFWSENRQKITGSVAGFFSIVSGLLAAKMFDPVLSPVVITWLGIISAIVTGMAGGVTVKTAFANTTREKVAASEAVVAVAERDTAIAMENALNTPSPITRIVP